jgi:hypothetical protein
MVVIPMSEYPTRKPGGGSSVMPEPPLSEALMKFRAGEIDADAYVELKIREATEHLSSLPPDKLDLVRRKLREEISDSQELKELIAEATRR